MTDRPPEDAVPPQNPVDRTIGDISTLGVKLAYPDASLDLRRCLSLERKNARQIPRPLKSGQRCALRAAEARCAQRCPVECGVAMQAVIAA